MSSLFVLQCGDRLEQYIKTRFERITGTTEQASSTKTRSGRLSKRMSSTSEQDEDKSPSDNDDESGEESDSEEEQSELSDASND